MHIKSVSTKSGSPDIIPSSCYSVSVIHQANQITSLKHQMFIYKHHLFYNVVVKTFPHVYKLPSEAFKTMLGFLSPLFLDNVNISYRFTQMTSLGLSSFRNKSFHQSIFRQTTRVKLSLQKLSYLG